MKNNYFFVIYDLYDNIKFLCNNVDEFCSLTGILSKHVNTRYRQNYQKGFNYISVVIDEKFYKCYRYLKDEI